MNMEGKTVTLREIDALVAEKVMGLAVEQWRFQREPECGSYVEWLSEWDVEHPDWKERYNEIHPAIVKTYTDTESSASHVVREICPFYSTDPAAAKLVREKLAERFMVLNLSCNRKEDPEARYTFSVSRHGAATSYYVEATTEEIAVSLCALRSVGIEAEWKERP